MATRTSNVGKFAGALAKQLRDRAAVGGEASPWPSVSAVGPTASYMALKGVVIAESYVRGEEAHAAMRLAVIPKRTPTVEGSTMPESVGLLLQVRQVPDLYLPDDPTIFSAHDTNVGLMAGLIAGAMGKAGVVTVGSMGDKATSNVLKATMIAQEYMSESLGQHGRLALIPRLNKFTEKDEERVRMLLTLVRRDEEPGEADEIHS